jgi:transposase
MFYLGLDVHGKWTTMVGFDPQTGEVVRLERVPNEGEALATALGGLAGPLHGVMEAGTNSWSVYRSLRPLFEALVVADPAHLWNRRTDREAKTDRRDALRMAQMLYRGEIESLYIPDERTQDLRSLVRGKIRASRWVTKLTNEIGSLLRAWGYVTPRSLLTKKGGATLDQVHLPARSARVLVLWRELQQKAQEIERELQSAIEEEAAAEPECALLESVPSVGPFTALLIRAEIGDIRRFRCPAALVSYVGLAPRVSQSGDHCSYGRLGPWGNRWLRYGLGMLAQRIANGHRDTRLHRLYWRVCLRQHHNTAKMAVARKATALIYHLLTRCQQWQEPDALAPARTGG